MSGGLLTAPAEVARACRAAGSCARVAVDTESNSFHAYHQKLCLVQLAWEGGEALLDPLALSVEALAPLVELLAAPGVVKLMHGADYDLRVLDRSLGARVSPLRDTQAAAQLLGLKQTGLGALLASELGIALDKSGQRANWGARPLPAELLAYAAADTRHLAALADRLESKLAAAGRVRWWEEECQALEGVRFEAPTPDDFAFERLPGARQLKGRARDRVAALFAWREELAGELDVAPFRVVAGDVLTALAQAAPESVGELAAVKGVPAGIARRHGAALLRLLATAPAAPARPRTPRQPPDREREGRLKTLRAARDTVAAEQGIEPGVLAPRQALEEVERQRPASQPALAACLGRHWRAEVLAPTLLPLVAGLGHPAADAGAH